MPQWMIALLPQLIIAAHPDLKAKILADIAQWELKAKETKGPVDDILVAILKGIMTVL